MEQERAVNKIANEMKMAGLISEEYTEEIKFYLRLAYGAGYDAWPKDSMVRNTRPVIHFNRRGEKLGEYKSIREAAIAAGYSNRFRGGDFIIANVLAGRHPCSKEGYVWKYADA